MDACARSLGGSRGRVDTIDALDYPCQRCAEASLGQDAKHALAERRIRCAGMADVSGRLRPIEEIPSGGVGSWRTRGVEKAGLASCVRYDAAFEPGVFCVLSESAGKLRGRGVLREE